jgi:hypothetical protein
MACSTFLSILPVATSEKERRAVLQKLLRPEGKYLHQGSTKQLKSSRSCEIALVACVIELATEYDESRHINQALWSLASSVAARGAELSGKPDTTTWAPKEHWELVLTDAFDQLATRLTGAASETRRVSLLKELRDPARKWRGEETGETI